MDRVKRFNESTKAAFRILLSFIECGILFGRLMEALPSFERNGTTTGSLSGKPRAIHWKMPYDGLNLNYARRRETVHRPAAGHGGEKNGGFAAEGPVNAPKALILGFVNSPV
ncbi:hypothetical protein [uncultured Desulfosarcina sp.]|uniref:hypothetical protein n=1 Tax=uncultured Desulfosarcina sp. TaxID=218289 RepID=UPI0029C85176|nr:hypothetical protein [uncultured Desulfosarcina sp.]